MLSVPVQDTSDAPVKKFFPSTSEFIEKAMAANKSVLVHCNEGIHSLCFFLSA